jgi:hypothetical protein
MEWLTREWDQGHWVACCVGVAAGVALAILGASGLAELGGVFVAVVLRWSMWQIPPPGRSRAPGAPADALSRLGQLAVVVLLIVLVAEIATSPAH